MSHKQVLDQYLRTSVQQSNHPSLRPIPNYRTSDIVRWCDFTQLTSCHIRLHNQWKNHIIAQCREKGSDIKFSGKKYSSILKSSSSNSWYLLDVNIVLLLGDAWSFMAFSFFCCFATARSNAIDFHDASNILWLRRLGNKLDSRLKMAENTCKHDLFSLKSFCTCAKKPRRLTSR